MPALAVPDERKLATVLFADVVGFTSLSEGTDPETVARTVDAAFRRMAQVVDEHGGTVDKYLGDCLMAVFGVPQAHEDDAERAVRAGLELIAAVAGLLNVSAGHRDGRWGRPARRGFAERVRDDHILNPGHTPCLKEREATCRVVNSAGRA